MWTQVFYLPERNLSGASPLARCAEHQVDFDKRGFPPAGYVIVCPVCGKLWARVELETEEPLWSCGNYVAQLLNCERCLQANWRGPSGSLVGLDIELPDEILRREVALHFKWFDQQGAAE